jgi:hypothetical protein
VALLARKNGHKNPGQARVCRLQLSLVMCLLTCSGVLAVVALAADRTSGCEVQGGPEAVVVEGALETGTVACPQISLFKPSACDECASPARSKAASR